MWGRDKTGASRVYVVACDSASNYPRTLLTGCVTALLHVYGYRLASLLIVSQQYVPPPMPIAMRPAPLIIRE